MAEPAIAGSRPGPMALALIASVFVVAMCGLVYELLASTIASYLLGDSVTQFSTIIGVYLFAMGIGSWCSRYAKRDELRLFIRAEILIALIGGWAAALLFLMFPVIDQFRVLLYALVVGIGFLVGLEIPLLMRILKQDFDFRETVSTVLTFDYVGALAASLLFPLILMPFIGMIRTGFLFGFANVAVAIALIAIQPRGKKMPVEMLAGIAVAVSLVIGFIGAERVQRFAETASLEEPIIHATSTPYQRIVLTRRGDNISLFLNGNLQFSSLDEYRYHEALVLPQHIDPGRRRRPCGARSASPPGGRACHARRPRSGNDAAFYRYAASRPAQRRLVQRSPDDGDQR
jgi:spermidine synthase